MHGDEWKDIKRTTKGKVKIDFNRDKYIDWFNAEKPAKATDLDDALFVFEHILNYKKNRAIFENQLSLRQ